MAETSGMKEISLKKQAPESKIDEAQSSLKEMAVALCYYYPAYTYEQALDIPINIAKKLVRFAKRKEAENYLNLTQIVAAPHSKKGAGVKKLITQYQKEMK